MAVDGEDGEDKIRNNTYSLILLDMNMPRLDGIGVLTSLVNKPPANQNGPIILLTNSGDDELVQQGIQKGAKSYLVKAEMNPDQLLEHINTLIS